MRLLLDTCVMVWYFQGSARIRPDLRRVLTDPSNEVATSEVSFLEVVIKHQLGKFPLKRAPSAWLPVLVRKHRLAQLSLGEQDIFELEKLPLLHRDPFDRLLIAQAQARGYDLVTPDPQIPKYDVRVVW